MNARAVTALSSLLIVTVSCTFSDRLPSSAPTWTIVVEPSLTLSDVGHEFNGISSAIRLADGRMLVANAGIPELALFDSGGGFLRAVGRKGQGPGEWNGAIAVFPWHSDSVAVYDASAQRWTVLAPDLSLARTALASDPSFLNPTWLYRGTVVQDIPTRPIPVWITAVLDSARLSDPGYTRIFRALRDSRGALWLNHTADSTRWTIFTVRGVSTGTATLPTGLTPLEIGPTWILALARDSLDLERVTLHQFTSPAGARPATADTSNAVLPSDPVLEEILPRLIMAQELFYAGHARYTTHPDSLELGTPFESPLHILGADKAHWAGVAVNPATGATCGTAIGWPAPLGWIEGAPFCGR